MRHKRTQRSLTLFIACIMIGILVLANSWVQAYDMANSGFENNLDGWTSLGTVIAGLGDDYPTSDKTWTVLPYQTKMAVLSPDVDVNNFSSAADALGLSTSSRSYLLGVFPGITNLAYIYADVNLAANETFTMSWNYVATDYDPFNDASFCSLVNLGSPADIPEVNGYTSQVSILGATVPGTGNYSTGSYGSTGWQTASFTSAGAGTYRLGFAVYNLDDYYLDPYLFIDKEPGTTLLDGVPFSPVPPDDDPPPPPATTIPTVSTGTVSIITTSTATIAGQVASDGGEFVFDRGAVISTSANPTTADGKFGGGSGTGLFSASVNGLSAGTTYHVRAYATNSKGTAYGNDVTFITVPSVPFATNASGIGKQSFTANWSGVAGAAGYRLDVATDAAFTQKLTAYNNLNVGLVTTYAVSGLSPATTYYYQVRAVNSSGDGASSNTISLLTDKASQTIDFPSLPVAVYGDADFSPAATATSGLAVTYQSDNPLVATIVDNKIHVVGAGDAVITAVQAGNDTWESAPAQTQNLTVLRKTLTVGASVQAADKYYDGDTAATISGAVLSGVLPDDEGQVVLSSGTIGHFLQTDVGTDLVVQTSMSLTGARADHYVVQQPSLKADILARPITATADDQSKTYGDTDPLLTWQVTTGNLIGDDTAAGELAREVGEAFGTYDILVGTLDFGANYDVTFVSDLLTVTARSITVTADDQSKTYGDADPTLTWQVTTGNLIGYDTATGELARESGEAFGTYNILVGTLDFGANYDVTFASDLLTVTARPITVTADAQSKTYGDADPLLTWQVTTGNLIGDDTATGDLSREVGEAVGDYEILLWTLDFGMNYTVNYVSSLLTVTARPITVTADAQSKTYGDEDLDLTWQVTTGNLIGDDTATGELARVSGEAFGTYGILVGTLDFGANYDVTFVSDLLTVTARPITVTADAQNKIYGDTDPDLTWQVTTGNLIGDDTATGELARVSGEAFGTYGILVGTLDFGANYDVTFVSDLLTVTARPITVTADAQSKTYGDADPLLTWQVTSGNLIGDDTATGDLSRKAGEAVGDYEILFWTLHFGENYAVNYVSSQLTVTARPITLTADAQSKTYGDADPLLTWQVTMGNLIGDDTATGELAREVGEAFGDYDILVGTLDFGANYDVTFVSDLLTVTARPITVTADAQSKTYGDTDPLLTWQVTTGNLIGDDTATGELTREDGEAFGDYDILVGTLDFGANYDVTYASAELLVSKRPLVIRALDSEKTYGEADPVWTVEIINLASWDHEAVVTALMFAREPGESVDVYAVTPSGAVADNYSIIMLPGSLTIKPRQLVITADTQTKEYGTSDPDLSFTITSGSLVGSDTIIGHLQREPGENVGTYAIMQDTLTAGDNYALTLVDGALIITPYAKPTVYGSVRNGFDVANSGQVSFIAEPAEGYGFAYWSDGHTVFYTQPELINPPGGIDAYQAIMWPMEPTTDKKAIVMSTGHESVCEFLDGKISMILPKHVDPESVIAVTAVADPSGNAATPAGMTGLSLFYHMLRSENLVDSNIRIVIDLEESGISLSDSEQQTLNLYRWNIASAVWETVSITAQGFDAATGTIWAEVDIFSTFGLFYTADKLPQTGEKLPVSPWLFLILAAGLAIILYSRKRLAGRS